MSVKTSVFSISWVDLWIESSASDGAGRAPAVSTGAQSKEIFAGVSEKPL